MINHTWFYYDLMKIYQLKFFHHLDQNIPHGSGWGILWIWTHDTFGRLAQKFVVEIFSHESYCFDWSACTKLPFHFFLQPFWRGQAVPKFKKKYKWNLQPKMTHSWCIIPGPQLLVQNLIIKICMCIVYLYCKILYISYCQISELYPPINIKITFYKYNTLSNDSYNSRLTNNNIL